MTRARNLGQLLEQGEKAPSGLAVGGLEHHRDRAGLLLRSGEARHASPEQEGVGILARLEAQVQAIDWLELHAEGHRRALFDAAGRRWLAP